MLISIIVPVYNVKEYIGECVNSLVNQAYKNIEILLIDDGSTDGTSLLCDELANTDSRIKVYHKENGGTFTARNLGIELAKGQYIMLIDPDDWFDLNTVEYIVQKIEKNNLDVLRFNYLREYGDCSVKKENTFLKENVVYKDEECRNVCRQIVGLVREELAHPENFNFLASACFNVYKKEIIDENNLRFYNNRKIAAFSDGLFNINFFKYAKSFEYVDKYFYHYRKTNENSSTANYRENYIEKQMLLFDEIKKAVKDIENEDFIQAYYNRIVFSIMEQCLNVLKSDKGFFKKYKEMKGILKNDSYSEACSHFELSYLSLKWKMYYLFVKKSFVPGVYLMTFAIKMLRKRG